jgi:hypothetical protein
MRHLLVRAVCVVVNLVIGEPGLVVTPEEERALAAAREHDAYFEAFRRRCMQWVAGEDPRRALEQ